jgi:hypothetical protein
MVKKIANDEYGESFYRRNLFRSEHWYSFPDIIPKIVLVILFLLLIYSFVMLFVTSRASARSDIVDVLYPNGQTATSGMARGENVELIPNGDTLLNQWTQHGCTGAGNHYQCIDDPVNGADSSVTYLEVSTPDYIEAFRIPDYSSLNYPATPDTIKNIDIVWQVKAASGDGMTKAGVRVGTHYTWGTVVAPSSWVDYTQSAMACPSCTWSEANLNGAMPAFTLITDALDLTDVSRIYLRFDWIRNAGATDMYKAIWEHTVDNAKSYLIASNSAADSILGIFQLDDYTLTTNAVIDSVNVNFTRLCSNNSESEGFLPFLNIGGNRYVSENCNGICENTWKTVSFCTWGATNPHSGNPWTDGDIDSLRVGVYSIGTSLSKELSSLYVRVVSHLPSDQENAKKKS